MVEAWGESSVYRDGLNKDLDQNRSHSIHSSVSQTKHLMVGCYCCIIIAITSSSIGVVTTKEFRWSSKMNIN